ncbi:MAG: hypothetical protein IKF90_18475 [Parasporobacterium sp.]|nr:hypothetical protein [Parasporobacterium sp.]
MTITENMRLKWALKYLEEEEAREEAALKTLDSVSMTEIIILRNKKYMYLAEVKQMIRNIKEKIEKNSGGLAS